VLAFFNACRRGPVVLLFVVASACATTAQKPAVSTSAPTYSNGVTWVTRSAEYQALVLQTFAQAGSAVEAGARGKAAGQWAVILDADETVISNLVYQQELERAGEQHSAARWNAWIRRREAVPMPGAKAFLDQVRALGGRIAIVTNRLESECLDTRAVFEREGLPFDAMLCRPDGQPSDKNPRFTAVAAGTAVGAAGPVEVVVWVGDNIQDFPALTQAVRDQGAAGFAAFGVRYFMLPNPMYGGWQ
jgi:acid phosphatase